MSKAGKKSETVSARNFTKTGVIVKWWHWLIGVALVLLLTMLTPRGKSTEFASFNMGSISSRAVIAPFDFEILKAQEELKKERNDAAGNILPVLTVNDSIKDDANRELSGFKNDSYRIIKNFPLSVINTFNDQSSTLSFEDSTLLSNGSEELFNQYGFRLATESWKFLIRLYDLEQQNNSSLYTSYFDRFINEILLYVYNQGLINVPVEQLFHRDGKVIILHGIEEETVELKRLLTPEKALKRVSSLLLSLFENKDFPKGAVSAGYEILQSFIRPNLMYDDAETLRRKEIAIARVPVAKGFVKKDELIIGSNIRVTQEHLDKLNSLATKRAEMGQSQGGLKAMLPLFGNFLLALLIVFLAGIFIAIVRPHIWQQCKLILLIAIIIGLVHAFQVLIPVKYDLSLYMFPAAVGAMLLAILIDMGVALAGTVAFALIAGLLQGSDYPITLTTILVGGAALFAVKKVQTRSDVMRAGLYLAAVYIPIVAALHFIRYASGQPLLSDLGIATANAVLSPMLVLGLVLICEKVFNITTDLTLLELIDLNHPLLRELGIKSPGTYHHSIMVGSLSDAAAREIGANALLARAGAYYHDIGKMQNRDCYIENQEVGSPNIHDRLSPLKSAEIVIDHVRLGQEAADRYHLPKLLKDFISEHHGRSRIAFFYAKAVKEKGAEIDDTPFRYAGPSPQSKETGIVMLADAVEAATRSMDDHSQQLIEETVDKLVNLRLSDGDLDECPLSMREIGIIKKTFVKELLGIYHQRVKYPELLTEDETTDNNDASENNVKKGQST
ncbi:MAG: HDIG domain-containing protein [Calditrichaeota bacterium]|nr:HDIG domain-containing protein [Calditrichota bacterium]